MQNIGLKIYFYFLNTISYK